MRKQVTKHRQVRLIRAVRIAVILLVACFVGARAKYVSTSHRHVAVPPTAPPREAARESVPSPTVQPVHEDPKTAFPASELPMVATEDGARTSLHYLAENGADLTRPMPSKHRIFAANAEIAARVVAWGHANGFEVRGPVMVRSHVGEPQQTLELVRTEVPDPARIEHEGRLILAAVQQTPGAFYQTWSGEIVR